MTAPAVLARPAVPAAPHRVLGALGVLGAPAFLVLWATGSPAAEGGVPAESRAAHLLMLAYLAGWAASAAGVRLERATGSGRGARAVTVVQLTGLALAALQNAQDLAGARPLGDGFYRATDAAWPLSHLFMLAVFAAVWRAGVWRGWRRWTPLACGLALPAAAAAGAAGGREAAGVAFAWAAAAAFASLGAAVASGRGPRG